MKFIQTKTGKTVEMTKSQAAYERLRGNLVPHVAHTDPLPSQVDISDQVDLATTPAAKVARRGRKRS